MATFQYKARDVSGKLIQGTMSADTDRAVAGRLQQMSCVPVAISELRVSPARSGIFEMFRRVTFAEVNIFTRQLVVLQKAGLPLLSSLAALSRQASNTVFKNIVEQIVRDIEGGTSFSEALSRHPKVFNQLYTSMVKSGEASGRLAEVLERLSVLGEYDERIRMRMKAAMRYPVIVVVSITIGFFILVTLVVPRFAAVYGKFTTELPLPTQILIGVQYVVSNFWWLLLLAVAAAVPLFRFCINTKQGRWWWDSLKLKIFIFGPLNLKVAMSRFCRLTGMLMDSGVPILQILDLVSDSVGNVVVASAIRKIKTSVSEGKGMLEPMAQSGLFPPVVIEMVAAGEKAGKIDTLLMYTSEYYDLQVTHTLDNLVSLIEPVLIFILAGVVMLMTLGIFLPMWNLMHVFKR